ncbi:hypothetical protein Y032_0154g3007 [Ancylostoma ceylanicum]|uniref:Peptidase C1A papain C-terminal domain-containing protein n=1 Tax=Ancylostoma ceylanicum TaxID=53326 RepID=A0A016T034_9BILA|nr:hypothetical protein Y032_0154g3007 [Ancylostoma ceylanicum]
MWILAALLATAFAAKPTTVEEFLAQPVEKDVEKLTGQAFVDYINEHQSFYKAEYSPDAEAFVKARIMDSKFLVTPKKEEVLMDVYGDDPPESFDARTQWPECRAIGTIRDQSSCGSCWAVASASAMSDEMCVQSNSSIKLMISDTDILSCCGLECGYGCQGGWPIEAYRWMERDGVVTGGKYRQKDVCKPYTFYPCGNHKDDPYYGPCPGYLWPTPKCRKSCQRKYKKTYQEDKHFDHRESQMRGESGKRQTASTTAAFALASSIHDKQLSVKIHPWINTRFCWLIAQLSNSATRSYFLPNNERSIRQEIYKNGPVVAAFKVYEDFSFYKGGIYVHKWGIQTGAHAVKVIGWGRENGTDYWLIANSWNTDWGEDGYFRIVRGTDNCEIERQMVGGIMRV